MSRSLNEISADYAAIEALLWEAGGEIEPVAEEALDEYLASLGDERDQKIEAYCFRMKTIEAVSKIRIAESKRLADLAAVDTANVERMKARLLAFFEIHGLTKLELEQFRIWTQQNGGKAPLQTDEWVESMPYELDDRFQVRYVRPSLETIREALENGELLDFARLLPRGKHIRIK